MKSIFILLLTAVLCTGLSAQNSTLTLYITSSIPGSTELTVYAVPMGSNDTTIVDVVMVTDTDETVVVYSYPDTISSAMVLLAYACDGVDLNVPAGFAFGPNTPGGEPVEGEIAVEIGCIDTECEWYLDVTPPNDLLSPTTFEVGIPSGNSGIWEWYVDGELVPANMAGGGLSWSDPYETICATMYSLGDCPDPRHPMLRIRKRRWRHGLPRRNRCGCAHPLPLHTMRRPVQSRFLVLLRALGELD